MLFRSSTSRTVAPVVIVASRLPSTMMTMERGVGVAEAVAWGASATADFPEGAAEEQLDAVLMASALDNITSMAERRT